MGKLTDDVPKPMLQIKGKPVLAYKIESLPDEIDEVIFVIGYLGNKIMEFFGDFYADKKIIYVEQKELNGGGAALHLVKDLLKDEFLVMMGDDLYAKEDVRKIMKNDLAILGLEVMDPKRFGIIYTNDRGYLEKVVEKPDIVGPAFANTALYKLNKNFFDYELVPTGEGNGEFGLPQTLAAMAKDHDVKIQKASAWFPIGKPEDLKEAEKIIEKFI